RGYDGIEQPDPPVRMLRRKKIVRPARRVRHMNATDFLNLARVREAGDVEHDRREVAVRRARPDLDRLHVVIATLELEVLPVHPSTLMDLRLLDRPVIESVRLARVLEGHDVEADRVRPA